MKYQSLRGGTWLNQPWFARASARASGRFWGDLSRRSEGRGFRCALIVWRRQ